MRNGARVIPIYDSASVPMFPVDGAACCAIDPDRRSFKVVLALPNGNAVFDLINNKAAGCKRGVAVGGRGPDPNGDVADGQMAHTVDCVGIHKIETGTSFVYNPEAFFGCESGIGFVF